MWWLSLLVPIGPILARMVIYLVEERGEEEKEMRALLKMNQAHKRRERKYSVAGCKMPVTKRV
jgi:hypothetical protein